MKVKHAIIFIIVGYCINVFGALQKVLHTPQADNVLTLGTFIILFGWLLLLYKILTHPKLKEFINW
jgi:hypothetical protein